MPPGTIVASGSLVSPGGAQGPSGSTLPVGTVIAYCAGGTPPASWMVADGSAVSRTLYPDLFSAIGTTYGTGDGSTTFNLPDLRGRTPVGTGQGTYAGATNRVLAATGGEELHALSIAELAAHNHAASDSGHTQTYRNVSGAGNIIAAGTQYNVFTDNTGVGYANISVANTGGGGAHNNMQPFLALVWIIKVSLTGGPTAQAPIANQTQAGLLNILSGNAADYVGGDNACHPLVIRTRDVNGLAPGFSQRLQLHDDCSYPVPNLTAGQLITTVPIPWYFSTNGGSVGQNSTAAGQDIYNKCYGVLGLGANTGSFWSALTPSAATLVGGLGPLDLYFRVAFTFLPTSGGGQAYYFGLSDGVNTASNAVYHSLLWLGSAASWRGACANAGTATTTPAVTSPTPLVFSNAAFTYFTLRISINAAWTSATFYVNGVNIGTIGGMFSVPRALYFWIYTATGTGAPSGTFIDDVVVDYQYVLP